MDDSNESANISENTPQKLWNKYFILLSVASFLLALCMMVYSSVLALYIDDIYRVLYENDTTGAATTTGIALAAFTITAIIVRLTGGRILDNNDYFKIIIIGLAIMGTASLFYNFFPIIWVIVLLRLIQGGSFSIAHTGLSVAVCEVVPPKRIGEGISYFGLGVSMALAIGPLLGLKLCEGGNFYVVFNVCTAALVAAAGCVFICLIKLRELSKQNLKKRKEKINTSTDKYVGIWKYIEKRSLPASVVCLTLALTVGFVSNFIPLFASRNGIVTAGLFFTCEAVTSLLSRLIIGRIINRFSPFALTVPSAVAAILTFVFVFMSVTNGYFLLLAGALMGLAVGFIQTTYNVVALRSAPSERRGAAASTFFLMMDIGIGGGGLLWGVIIDNFGFNVAISGCIFCIILTVILSGIYMRSPKYLS